MPPCNTIVDSCSYFRLAQNIRPLLKREFGKEKHCLGVIKELDEEYAKNPTLKHKFFWVNQEEYTEKQTKIQIIELKRLIARKWGASKYLIDSRLEVMEMFNFIKQDTEFPTLFVLKPNSKR